MYQQVVEDETFTVPADLVPSYEALLEETGVRYLSRERTYYAPPFGSIRRLTKDFARAVGRLDPAASNSRIMIRGVDYLLFECGWVNTGR